MGSDSSKLKRSVSVFATADKRTSLKLRQNRVPSIKVANSPGCSIENVARQDSLFNGTFN